MTLAATSIRMPRVLKLRIARLARQSGASPHALMLRMIEDQVDAAERHQAFLADARAADAGMGDTGEGYAAADVHAYLESLASGGHPARPKPVAWRK